MTRGGSGIRAVAFAVVALGLAQCDRDRTPVDAPAATAPLVTPSPSLDRAALLLALSRAASDHAAGRASEDGLAGRTFRIGLAFACPGETLASTSGVPSARRAEDGRRLELGLTPADWTRSPLVLSAGETPAWERVDGLWITRPWMAAEGCPARPVAPMLGGPPSPGTVASSKTIVLEPIIPIPPPPSPMTAGLAVISDEETSRLGRRAGEAWRHVVRGHADAPMIPSLGYRLILGGRIGRFPDGHALRCASQSPDTRPVCVAAVDLDLVAFEDASGARLSEWRPT